MEFGIWKAMKVFGENSVSDAEDCVKDAEDCVKEAEEFVSKEGSSEATNLLKLAKDMEQKARKFLEYSKKCLTVVNKVLNGEMDSESANKLFADWDKDTNHIANEMNMASEAYFDAFEEFYSK